MDRENTVACLQGELCSGCGACYNACPNDAIQMVMNREGFYEPEINWVKCISCGACKRTCPVLNVPRDTDKKPLAYAVKGTKDVLAGSSSGGVFAILADYILEHQGYVCGAAYGDGFEVHHLLTNTREGMQKIRRSKYVQSQTDLVFRDVRRLLEDGTLVLFSGTPCQVAGLKHFLKKPYKNLFTLDIICHGVPAPGSWARYLEENVDVDKLKDIDFRHKGNHGFKKLHISLKYKNGEEYIQPSSRNPYFRHFLRNLGLRNSCATCEFAVFPRQGDFSAGDFWGAEKHYPELIDSDSGLSVLFFNTEHSKELLPYLEGRFELMKPITTEEAMAANRRNVTRTMHSNRERFFEMMRFNSFEDSVMKNTQKTYDVAIYGSTVGSNYGSLITYYALYRSIQKMGYSVVLIAPPLPKDGKEVQTHAQRFVKQYQELSDPLPSNEFSKYNELAKIFLLGSDQIWNYTLFSGRKETLYLDFVKDDKKKIAYAASFGFSEPTIFPDYPERYPVISRLMKHLDYISVREQDAVEICEKYYDVEATHVMDPVFLLKKSDYEKLAVNAKNKPTGKYMCVYALTPKEDINRVFQYVSEKMNLPRVNMATGNPEKYKRKKKNFDMPYCENLQMEEWLYNIMNAEIVVTDSYHCVCFSIIFRKPFILIQRAWAISRIESLLTKLNLTDRWFQNADDFLAHEQVLKQSIDYDAVHQIVNKEIFLSEGWLRNALTADKKIVPVTTIDRDRYMQRELKSLYGASDINTYFKALGERIDEFIVMMGVKGGNTGYLNQTRFFRSLNIGATTKKKMERKGFAYICDIQNETIMKKMRDMSHVVYYFGGTQFTVISEGRAYKTNKDKVMELYIECNNRREVYAADKDGMYIVVYSKLMQKAVDYVYLEGKGEDKLQIEHR